MLNLCQESLRDIVLRIYRYVIEHDTRFADLIEPLQGKSLAVTLTAPVEITLAMTLSEKGIHFIDASEADVSITGSWQSFITQIPQFDFIVPDSLEVKGNMRVAQLWQRLFKKISPDWPALLEPVLGDMLTGVIENSVSTAFKEASHVKDAIKAQIKEAFQMNTQKGK